MSNCIQKDFVIQSQNVLQFSTQIWQKLLGTFQGFLYVHTYKQIPLLNKTLVPYHKDMSLYISSLHLPSMKGIWTISSHSEVTCFYHVLENQRYRQKTKLNKKDKNKNLKLVVNENAVSTLFLSLSFFFLSPSHKSWNLTKKEK